MNKSMFQNVPKTYSIWSNTHNRATNTTRWVVWDESCNNCRALPNLLEKHKKNAHKATIINAFDAPMIFGYGAPMREPSSKVLNCRWSRLQWWWWCPSVVPLSGPLSSVLSTFLIVGSSSYSAHSLIIIQSAGYSLLHLTQQNLISGYIVATTTSRFPCCVLRVLWWKTTNENPKTYKLSSWAIY